MSLPFTPVAMTQLLQAHSVTTLTDITALRVCVWGGGVKEIPHIWEEFLNSRL